MIAFYWGHRELEGKTIKEISEVGGKSPEDCYVDMVLERMCPLGIFFSQNMDTVREIMKQDYVLTASDGGTYKKGMLKPHPRVYGTFPRKLRLVAIENKWMTLPAAIRSMTSLPAEKFRLKERGKIAKGYAADIAVIDLENFRDTATYLDPHQYATGVKHLLINGIAAIENGNATDLAGGMALRR